MQKAYEYNKDASLKSMTDSMNHRLDRANKYDFAGRMSEGLTGADARGETIPPFNRYYEIPYKQNFSYDSLGNMTSRRNEQWGTMYPQTYTYENTRITNTGWTYDADGRVLSSPYPDGPTTATYDADGKLRTQITLEDSNLTHAYDGNGVETKRTAQRWKASNSTWINDNVRGKTYFIRSSVLGGQTITEVNPVRTKSYVIGAGTKIATQLRTTTSNQLYFEQTDAIGTSIRNTLPNGGEPILWRQNAEFAAVELALDGSNVGNENPDIANPPEIPEFVAPNHNEDMTVINGRLQPCEIMIDSFMESCRTAGFLARAGVLQVQLSDGHGHTAYADVEEMLGQLFTRTSLTVRGRWDGNAFYPTSFVGTTFGFIDISWSPQQQTQPPNGPSTTNKTKPDYTKFWQAFDFCTKGMFGVDAVARSENKFDFQGQVWQPDDSTVTTSFSIGVDTTSFSVAEMKALGVTMARSVAGKPLVGLYSWQSAIAGRAILLQSNTVFVANDINRRTGTSVGQIYEGAGLGLPLALTVKVHEVGNSLATLTGKTFLPDFRPDQWGFDVYGSEQHTGQAFENCVLINYKNLRAGRDMRVAK